MINRKTIIVTGGAGFLGMNLMKKLIEQGHNVLSIDNHSSSSKTLMGERREELNEIARRSGSRFMFYIEDIRSTTGIANAMRSFAKVTKDEGIDQIYNLACPASPPKYQADPMGTMMTNVLGTENMLLVASKKNARFLQASTSECYGDPEVHPQPERYNGNVNSYGPRACYDNGKRSAETLCYDYKYTLGVDTRIVRIFNTYGPGMDIDDGRVITNFIKKSLAGEPMTIYGDGSATRSFCYVDDLIDGLVLAMEEPTHINNGLELSGVWSGDPINIGNCDEFTLKELSEEIKKLIPNLPPVKHARIPQDDPQRRQPVLVRASYLLGYKPTIGLSEGLKNTIAYFAPPNVIKDLNLVSVSLTKEPVNPNCKIVNPD